MAGNAITYFFHHFFHCLTAAVQLFIEFVFLQWWGEQRVWGHRRLSSAAQHVPNQERQTGKQDFSCMSVSLVVDIFSRHVNLHFCCLLTNNYWYLTTDGKCISSKSKCCSIYFFYKIKSFEWIKEQKEMFCNICLPFLSLRLSWDCPCLILYSNICQYCMMRKKFVNIEFF